MEASQHLWGHLGVGVVPDVLLSRVQKGAGRGLAQAIPEEQ